MATARLASDSQKTCPPFRQTEIMLRLGNHHVNRLIAKISSRTRETRTHR